MTNANLKTAVEAFCRRRRFRPFAVDFSNGQRLIVVHPEFLVVRNGLAYHFDPRLGYRLFDGDNVWRLADIESGS